MTWFEPLPESTSLVWKITLGVQILGPAQPAQNKFARDLRAASVAKGSADLLSLWAGTGEGELWRCSTSELIDTLFAG
ncbi:hypothetical protein ATY81_14360 [Rhizobium sp. R72]|nr:hypothetical protein ATY81_14360 [Rhizobium sp. R72]OWV94037.1 hypothetical protein ATY80_14360 [Rhizobium sp. R711]